MAREMSIQKQARALGDPTRYRIFRYLADADHPVDVAELTSHLGLNHNGIRQHLARLLDAELVVEDTATQGTPGRPRLIYRTDPAADERWGGAGPYQQLSRLLVDVIASGSTPAEAGRRAGRALPVRRGQGPVPAMHEAIARGGFDPTVRERSNGVEFILHNCPFADTAVVDPATVCGLHLGLAQGLADQLEGVTVDELVRRDPHRAGCRLRFHLSDSDRKATRP